MKDLNDITTKMMEHICDKLCRYPREAQDQEELEYICTECKMGRFVCDIINQGTSNLEQLTTLDKFAELINAGNLEEFGSKACVWAENKNAGDCIHGEDGPGDTALCKECIKRWLMEEAID